MSLLNICFFLLNAIRASGFTGMVFNNDDSQFVTRAERNCNYRKSNWQIQGGSPTCTVVDRCFGYATLKDMSTCLAGSYHQFHYPMGGIVSTLPV
jgi:hypothetical protein